MSLTSNTSREERSEPMSLHAILPFVRPIQPLLEDPDVTDIMVNAGGVVFAERAGRLYAVADTVIGDKALQVALRNIARRLGDDISEEKPILDARLPDGSRVTALLPPCSVGGATLAIRKFQTRRYDVEELVRVGAISSERLAF